MSAVLCLDAEWRPLRIETWQRAICDVILGKTEVIEYSRDRTIQGASREYPMPSVVRIVRRFKREKIRIKFSRLNVYTRDHFTCFGAGTRILMADGRQLSIENVRPGDQVIDAFGSPQKVVDSRKRIADNAVEVHHRGSFERTLTTADHRYLTPTGSFVPIGEFPEYLVFPRRVSYIFNSSLFVEVGKFLPDEKWFRFKSGRLYLTKRPHEHGLPVTIPVSEDFAQLLGIYCADGSSTDQGLVVWSLNTTTKKHLYPFVVAQIEKLGLCAAVDEYPDRHVLNVRTCSKLLKTLLQKTCGAGAKNKKIPYALIGRHHVAFLRGVFQGDGHFDPIRKKIAYTSTSYALIFGVQALLWGIGVFPTVQHIQREGRLASWTLVLNAENYSVFMREVMGENVEDAERIFGDDAFVYRRLQDVTPIMDDVVVYDLEVANTHSFIANGLAVHNCQYCGHRFMTEELTFDHVVPRAKGGKTTWENILCACRSCNAMKGDRTVEQAGMKLITRPKKPHYLPIVTVAASRTRVPPEWLPYWTVELSKD